MAERPGVMELWDIHREGTSLDKWNAMCAKDRKVGGLAYPEPPPLQWRFWQGEAAERRCRRCIELQQREHFTERTGIELFDAVPMAEVAR